MSNYVKLATDAGDQYLSTLSEMQENFLKASSAFAAKFTPPTPAFEIPAAVAAAVPTPSRSDGSELRVRPEAAEAAERASPRSCSRRARPRDEVTGSQAAAASFPPGAAAAPCFALKERTGRLKLPAREPNDERDLG